MRTQPAFQGHRECTGAARSDDLPRFCQPIQRAWSNLAISSPSKYVALLGAKICNCVFVVVRQFPEGPQYTYVDNFAKETSTDSLYFREVFKLLCAQGALQRCDQNLDCRRQWQHDVCSHARAHTSSPRPTLPKLRNRLLAVNALGYDQRYLWVFLTIHEVRIFVNCCAATASTLWWRY